MDYLSLARSWVLATRPSSRASGDRRNRPVVRDIPFRFSWRVSLALDVRLVLEFMNHNDPLFVVLSHHHPGSSRSVSHRARLSMGVRPPARDELLADSWPAGRLLPGWDQRGRRARAGARG